MPAAATPSPASPASPASSETDDESQLSSGITEPATGPRRSRKDRRAGRRNRADSKASAGEGGIFTLPNLSLSNFMRWNDQNAKPSYLGVHGNHELYDLKRDFMLDLTRAMTEYGLPTHRLEYHLETVGECLGIQSSFTVLPGVILMSFTAEKRTSETFFLKSKQGYNMGKLLLVSELCNSVVRGMMTTQQARTSLADIRAIKTAPLWTALITYPFVSFGFCSLIIGGTWGDSIIAAIVSLPVAALTMTGVKVPGIRYLLDFLSAFSATLLGNCLRVPLQSYFGCMTSLKIVLGAVAVPLPGLALTNGIIELSTHNVISGTVHILNAIFTALLLGFGYTIGDNLTQLLPLDVQAATCPTHPISPIWSILILPAMAFGFNVLVHPSPKQHAIMMFTQALGYTITTVLPMFTIFQNSVEPVTIIAAFSIGLTANLYARFTRDVAIAPIIGGILPLVPGSMGFRTFAVRDGSGIAMQMLTISVCLTIGLLMASLLVWPIRGPRLKYLTV
eukprot:jgi/Hompol1/1565/HPOL_005638-RA